MNRRIRADHARGKTRYPETDAAFHETRLWLDAAQARGEAAVVVRFTPGESLDGLPRRDACLLYDVCTCEPDSGALRGGLPDHHPAQHRRLTETPGPCLVRRTGRVQGAIGAARLR